jgi:hypothetical protein
MIYAIFELVALKANTVRCTLCGLETKQGAGGAGAHARMHAAKGEAIEVKSWSGRRDYLPAEGRDTPADPKKPRTLGPPSHLSSIRHAFERLVVPLGEVECGDEVGDVRAVHDEDGAP